MYLFECTVHWYEWDSSDLLLILVNGHVYPITQFNALSMIGKLFCNVHCLVPPTSLQLELRKSHQFFHKYSMYLGKNIDVVGSIYRCVSKWVRNQCLSHHFHHKNTTCDSVISVFLSRMLFFSLIRIIRFAKMKKLFHLSGTLHSVQPKVMMINARKPLRQMIFFT